MNQTEFLYWLQGMLEYTSIGSLSEKDIREKLQGIKDHLKLVFDKQTPAATPLGCGPEKKLDKKDNSIEPSEALRKLFEENARKQKEGRIPGKEWPIPVPYKYGPHYWLDNMPCDWGIPPQFKPGTLIC